MTKDQLSHLRLITTGGAILNGNRVERLGAPTLVPKKAEQLHLPHLDSLTLVLVSVDIFRGLADFSDCLRALKPRRVFDVRTIPRLDVLGGARSHVFSMFSKHGTRYVDLLGQLGVHSERSQEARPTRWGKKMAEQIEASHLLAGNILLLFDSRELLEASAVVLPGTLKAVINRPVAVATYSI